MEVCGDNHACNLTRTSFVMFLAEIKPAIPNF